MNNEFFITEIKKELDYLFKNYEVPLDTLSQLVEMLSERLDLPEPRLGEVTTPFSDDLGIERHDYYNQRELGEVHDTFNVEIRQGNGNPITLTRQVIRCSQDDGSYLQSMVDVLSKLRN